MTTSRAYAEYLAADASIDRAAVVREAWRLAKRRFGYDAGTLKIPGFGPPTGTGPHGTLRDYFASAQRSAWAAARDARSKIINSHPNSRALFGYPVAA